MEGNVVELVSKITDNKYTAVEMDESLPTGFKVAGGGSRLFFDRGVNMLNVAVSRAKDSFFVFGEMSLFDPTAKTPSGMLAHYHTRHCRPFIT